MDVSNEQTAVDLRKINDRRLLNAAIAARARVRDLAIHAASGNWLDPNTFRSVVSDVGALSSLPPAPYPPVVTNPDGTMRTPDALEVYAWCATAMLLLDFSIAALNMEP